MDSREARLYFRRYANVKITKYHNKKRKENIYRISNLQIPRKFSLYRMLSMLNLSTFLSLCRRTHHAIALSSRLYSIFDIWHWHDVEKYEHYKKYDYSLFDIISFTKLINFLNKQLKLIVFSIEKLKIMDCRMFELRHPLPSHRGYSREEAQQRHVTNTMFSLLQMCQQKLIQAIKVALAQFPNQVNEAGI